MDTKSEDIMFKRLKPDFYLKHYTQITPEWLKENNVKFILSDLDGTLSSQDKEETGEFEKWYKSIEKAGTGLIVISNNTQERVDEFIHKYKIVGLGDCKKPSSRKIEENFMEKGLNPETTILLGDQIFTDVWCGKKIGIRTALVDSIPGNELWHRKLKVPLEKILMKGWRLI